MTPEDRVIDAVAWPRGHADTIGGGDSIDVERLTSSLVARSLPADVVGPLVSGLSGLWLLTEPPDVLADDLACCHPPPPPGEVRVIIRRPGGPDRARLTVVAADRPGLLSTTAGVIASFGLAVTEAVATTWPASHLALQALTVEDPQRRAWSVERWDRLAERVRDVMSGGPVPAVVWRPRGSARVSVERLDLEHSLLSVQAQDRVGLLWAIASHLCELRINIAAAGVQSEDCCAVDYFLLDGYPDAEELTAHLAGRRRTR